MKSILKQKSTKTVITILLCTFSLFCLSTIAYSAFSSTMNITGLAHSRVEADVRITNFSLDEIVNATSQYEEFSKNTVSSSVKFNDNASVTYKVEVTNYGATDIGIYEITGLPENVSYELIDYNLKDKLCNINGKCNSYSTKVFYIKITGDSLETEFTLNFIFREYHTINYVNFTGTYPSEVIDGETIEIDLSLDKPQVVMVDSQKYIDYSYSNNIINIKNITCNITLEAVNDEIYEYDYTGTIQTFSAPYDGVYKIELWGAAGNSYSDGSFKGGLGGYTSGNLILQKGEKLNINIGIIGTTAVGNSGANEAGLYGGGATDIRTSTNILSRIMIAGGGGGAGRRGEQFGDGNGGYGGGLVGGTGQSINNSTAYGYGYGTGGEQTTGGLFYWYEKGSGLATTGLHSYFNQTQMNGTFSAGGSGAAKGGGGYYGGGGSYHGGAGGGSSFISGHTGCNAISSISTESNIIHTGKSLHYSHYQFTDTVMIDGAGFKWTTKRESYTGMPTYDGTSTMTGNSENGHAKITLIKSMMEYPVVYTDIEGDYPLTAKKGENLVIEFKENAPAIISVLINGVEANSYTYKNKILTVENITGKVEIKANIISSTYTYNGTLQTFTSPYSGIYKVELWGAQGGGISSFEGGLGSYTSGKIILTKGTTLNVVVGSAGSKSTVGYNGSGNSISTSYGASGGGATDIRIATSSLSRIMIAAGGGGASNRGSKYGDGNGGCGGGLIGGSGQSINNSKAYGYGYGKGGEQTTGGLFYWYEKGSGLAATGNHSYFNETQMNGTFLTGGLGASGGGGGYYGGAGSYHGGAGGGSSFISGHNGCDAINSSSTHTGQSIHYSNYSFEDTKMIDGEGYLWTTEKGSQTGMPTHDGTSTMTGNTGNGYAKITLIELT